MSGVGNATGTHEEAEAHVCEHVALISVRVAEVWQRVSPQPQVQTIAVSPEDLRDARQEVSKRDREQPGRDVCREQHLPRGFRSPSLNEQSEQVDEPSKRDALAAKGQPEPAHVLAMVLSQSLRRANCGAAHSLCHTLGSEGAESRNRPSADIATRQLCCRCARTST
eukprot:762657-Hanusia_phi.AAC.2